MDKIIKLCARSIVSLLNDDLDKYRSYKDKALDLYPERENIFLIEDCLPRKIKIKLYELVS